MKKIISFVLLFMMVCSIAYANTVEIDTVNVTDTAITVNFNTEGLSDGDQLTVLTYQADSADVAPTENNIKYIDQISKSTASSLSFSLADTPSGTYQIKMGGTDVASPDALSVTIDEKMSGSLNFMKNEASVFAQVLAKPQVITNDKGSFYVVKPENNYIAASASVPELEGYTIKGYGIRLNAENYAANVDLTTDKKYGILFTGAEDGKVVSVTPYVTYEKDGETITYYGTTKSQTVTFTR